MVEVSVEGISKSYGAVVALSEVNLTVAEGELLVLLGPSGCGKTTLLRTIAGFVSPTAGKIRIAGEDVTYAAPRTRNIGMVFQNYALFPNMTVAENVGFGLKERRVERSEIARRVETMLETVRLSGMGARYIDELSGGQQQRVALARALAISPRVLLMDEPLGALDQKLRESMQIELQHLQKSFGITTILVTHDQQEAMSLADRIVVMSDGRIRQIGRPDELYRNPADKFVAQFIGRTNLLRASVTKRQGDGCLIAFESPGLPEIHSDRPYEVGTELDFSIRPEQLEIVHEGNGADYTIDGSIEQQIYLGNTVYYLVGFGGGERLLVETDPGRHDLSVGKQVRLAWRPEDAPVFVAVGA